MPAPKSPKTGFGLTTQSSLAVREARLARAYGEDRRARDAPPTARRATKDAAPPALRLNLGEEAGTVRALAPKPARRPDRPRSPSRRSPEPASASPDRGPADAPTVTIRVLDDARNTRREFVRELKPVLREMPYFRAHLAGRVDEAVLREMTDDSGDALSDATANANANTGTAATRPRGTREAPPSRMRDGTKRRSTSARGETADESQSGKKKKNVRRVELTVHCDVEIFARLLAHVDETQKDASLKKTGSDIPDIPNPEALTVRDCVPVLVASEFLACALVESCSRRRVGAREGARPPSRTPRQDAGPPRGARLGGDTRARGRGRSTGRPRRAVSRRLGASVASVRAQAACVVRRNRRGNRRGESRSLRGLWGPGPTRTENKNNPFVALRVVRARVPDKRRSFFVVRARRARERRVRRARRREARPRAALRRRGVFGRVTRGARPQARLLVPVGSDARPTGVRAVRREGRRGGGAGRVPLPPARGGF